MKRISSQVLYVFSGLPGAGKSALAVQLAKERSAVYLRIDSIEEVLDESRGIGGGPEGYMVAYRLGLDNLRLGNDVVADCVNPIGSTRDAWRRIAESAMAKIVEIEVVCSDASEHRQRVESRVPGEKRTVTWAEVQNREYAPWGEGRILVDTAGRSPAESFDILARAVESRLILEE